MEQENRNQQNAAPQVSLGDQIKVRREKLAQLQAEGMDPFTITRFVSTTTAQEIKDHFDEMEGKPVSIAGRLMSKRGMVTIDSSVVSTYNELAYAASLSYSCAMDVTVAQAGVMDAIYTVRRICLESFIPANV